MLPSGSLSLASLGIRCSLARPQQALGAEGNKLLDLRGMLLALGGVHLHVFSGVHVARNEPSELLSQHGRTEHTLDFAILQGLRIRCG